jgi:hypothetical protein
MTTERTQHEQQAYDLGVEAAKAAASWVLDGNASDEHYRALLKMIDDGDPRVDDSLPRCPDLSGEWADDRTPLSLACEIVSREESGDEIDPHLVDALADAFEEGVSDTFMDECERLLREALS